MASSSKGSKHEHEGSKAQNHTHPHGRNEKSLSRLLFPSSAQIAGAIDSQMAEMGYTSGWPGHGNHAKETKEPELVRAIHAQTDVVEKTPRKTGIGVIHQGERPYQTSKSQSKGPDHSASGPILICSEEVNDLDSFLKRIKRAKVVPTKFRPSAGDVIIAAKQKVVDPELEILEPSTTTEPTEFYPSLNLTQLNGLVALYKDSFYFVDDGEYRKSVLDAYKFEEGDVVARLGHFNENWHWIPASQFEFYLYYPKQLDGDCCKDEDGEVGPWVLLTRAGKMPTGDHELASTPRPWPSVEPRDLLHFSTLSYPFEFRDGDILMHLTNDKTLFKPWNVGMNAYVEHSQNRGEPAKNLQPFDKVLRYGIQVRHDPTNGRESTTIYVELYQYFGKSEWKFLGKNEGLYNHATTLPAMIRLNVNSPQPGDIIINRRCCRPWNATEKSGGLVEVYKDEPFFTLLAEPRDKMKKHIWGIGSDTTIVRFGTFANKKWNWMPKPSIDIFILNARGISFRLHCRITWDNDWRPRANFSFSTPNPKRLCEVPCGFKPKSGDIIIRFLANDFEWVGGEQVWEPSVEIEFFNAMVGNRLENGTWLLRVGYERSDKNSACTDVTAELYCYKVHPRNRKSRYWEFKGRDSYVFGAMEWPQTHGLFSRKELDQSYADPDSDLEKCDSSAAKAEEDHSQAVRQFISSLGFQDMAYPLKDPWWWSLTDAPPQLLDKH